VDRAPKKAFALLGVLATFGSAAASGPIVLPLRLAGHFPIVMARVDGLDVPLVFDTGISDTVVLEPSALDHIKAVLLDDFSKALDAKGNLKDSQKVRVSRLQLGDSVFTDVIGRLATHALTYKPPDVGQEGWLGTGLLKTYEVVLDYPHLKMTLVPLAANDTPTEYCHGTSVPFAVTTGAAEPFTKADTDMGQLTLGWDTGSQLSFVSQEVIHRGHAQVSGEDVITQRFVLGGTDFGRWQFKWMELHLPFFDGTIGYDFFATHVVCIDFPHRLVVVPS